MNPEHRVAVHRIASIVSTAGLYLLSGIAHANVIVSESLSFASEDQSMWGTGSALQLDETIFLGPQWNKSATVGGFVGGETQILNPVWVACLGLCSAPKHITVDTSTGLQASATTTGRVGFELGYTMDSGSVDALVNYATQAIVPDPRDFGPGEFISLNPTSTLTGESLETQFPTMSASLSVVLEVSASFAATGCAVGACTGVSFNTGTIGGTQELISFNEDGEGGIEYFGGSGFLSDALDTAVALGLVDLPTGFPAELEIPVPAGLGNLGTITQHLPEPNTSGGLDATGTKLTSTGSDDLLDLSLDVDNIISVGATGVGGLFGGDVNLGGGFGLSYDLINVAMGPQIDLVQSFEFTPSLYVDLEFSELVDVQGHGQVMSVDGLLWNQLPMMAFLSRTTTVTPTFYLGADIGGAFFANAGALLNQLLLDVDGNIRVDLLTASFTTPFGDLNLGVGNLLNHSFDLFTTPALFSTRFAMAGFDPIAGASFVVAVPEPATLMLLGTGLFLVVVARRRRTLVS